MKNQLAQYEHVSGDFLKDPLVIENNTKSHELVL